MNVSPFDFLAVFLGAGIGGTLRFALGLGARAGGWPLGAGTLLINLLGSFLIGVAAALLSQRSPVASAFFITGLLGGFTTFSALSFEIVALATTGRVGQAVTWAFLSLAGGPLLAAVGYRVTSGQWVLPTAG